MTILKYTDIKLRCCSNAAPQQWDQQQPAQPQQPQQLNGAGIQFEQAAPKPALNFKLGETKPVRSRYVDVWASTHGNAGMLLSPEDVNVWRLYLWAKSCVWLSFYQG